MSRDDARGVHLTRSFRSAFRDRTVRSHAVRVCARDVVSSALSAISGYLHRPARVEWLRARLVAGAIQARVLSPIAPDPDSPSAGVGDVIGAEIAARRARCLSVAPVEPS